MSEYKGNQEEVIFQPAEINEINFGLVKHLAKILKEYPSLRELLGKGKLDILDPSRKFSTLNWDYTFARLVPDFLELSIIKRPHSQQAVDSGIIEERVDIVFGDNPLIQHDITKQGELKLPPDKNTPEAVKKVTAFISDIEPQV